RTATYYFSLHYALPISHSGSGHRVELGGVRPSGGRAVLGGVRHVRPLLGVRVEVLHAPGLGYGHPLAQPGVGIGPEHHLGTMDAYWLLPGVLQPPGGRFVPAPGRPDRVLGATGVHTLTVVDGIHVVPAGGELGRRGRAGRDVLPLAAEIVHGEGDLG